MYTRSFSSKVWKSRINIFWWLIGMKFHANNAFNTSEQHMYRFLWMISLYSALPPCHHKATNLQSLHDESMGVQGLILCKKRPAKHCLGLIRT